MSPLINNTLISILSLIYVFAVVGIMDKLVKRGFPQDLSRKIVHICAASWLLFWPLFDPSHLSKYLNIVPSFVWMILLFQKGFFAKPDDEAVKTMTRTGDRKELLRGPLYFTVIMNILGTVYFFNPIAAVSMGILGWGDGLAPYFGQKYGKHKYNFVTEKSVEGSIAFVIFGFFGSVLFSLVIFGEFNLIYILISLAASAIVEALSPKDMDNVFVPVTCIIISVFFY